MTIEQMKNEACKCFGISRDLLDGKSRKKEVICVKIALSGILRSKGYTLSEIGDILNMTHATVLHHTRTLNDRMRYDYDFRMCYNKLNEII